MARTSAWHLRLGVRGKLISLVMLLVVPLLALEGVGIYFRFDRQVQMELQANEAMAGAVSTALNNYLESLWDAELAIGTALAYSHTTDREALEVYLHTQLADHPTVRSLSWIDPQGRVVASTSTGARGQYVGDRDYLQRVLQGAEKDLSDLYMNRLSDIPTVSVSRGIYQNGEVVGVMVAGIDPERLRDVLPSMNGTARDATLVDRNGTVAFSTSPLNAEHFGRLLPPDHPVFRSLKGERVAGRTYMVVNGQTLTGVSIPVPFTGWAYYATAPLDEVLAPARADAWREVAGLLLVSFLSLVGAILAASGVVRPILALQRAAQAISAGNLAARVHPVGFDEVAATARTFDTMASRVQTADADQRARVSAVATLVQRTLSGADTSALAGEAADLVVRGLGGQAAAVLEAVPSAQGFVRRGSAGAVAGRPDESGADPLTPLAAFALKQAEPMVVPDLGAVPEPFPGASALVALSLGSCMAVIIGGPERPFGVLALAASDRRQFSQSDLHFLEAVANVLATAVERKRTEAEQVFLEEASTVLAQSLDYDATLNNLARLAAGRLCDWCVIEIEERDGSLRTVAAAHADPAKLEQGLEFTRLYDFAASRRHSVSELLSNRRSVLHGDLTGDTMPVRDQSPEHLELIRWLGLTSAMAVPLVVCGRAIGVITFLSAESKRRYTPSDLVLAEELAHRAALAVDHARMYGEAKAALEERDRALAQAEAERSRLLTLFEQAPAIICMLYGPGHVIAMANHRFVQATGNRANVGRPIIQSMPELRAQGVDELLNQVLATGIPYEGSEIPLKVDRSGQGPLEEGVFDFVLQPVRDGAGHVEGILVYAVDVTDQVRSRRKIETLAAELRERARQQAAVSALEQHLIAGRPLDDLLKEAAATVADVLGVEFSAIAELLPDDKTLIMHGTQGWPVECQLQPFQMDGIEALTSCTLASAEPVVTADIDRETRFQPMPLLKEMGIRSGVSLVIPGEEGPYGILAVHARNPREFSRDAVCFLGTVALTIAAAVDQQRKEQRLSAQHAVALELVDAQGVRESVPRILEAICRGLGWDLGVLWIVESDGNGLRCEAIWKAEELQVDRFVDLTRSMTVKRGEGLVGEAWASGAPVCVPDIAERRGYPRWEVAREADLHTGFWFPVVAGKEILGIVECISRSEWQPDSTLLRTATSLGIQIGQFLQRRRAEEQLRTLNGELEQRVTERTAELAAANQELEAFAYSVSHDLRAPLRTIEGFGQALWEDHGEALGPEGQDFLRRIRESSRHMGGLIDDLLRLSRVVRAEIRREPVDLSGMARTVANELIRLAPDRKVTFQIEPYVTANGDERLLQVMLGNLLANAWKFTGRQSDAIIAFGKTMQADRPVYYVKDNGVGFDMAYAGKLFMPFQRLHKASEFEGTGVGLATVHRVVQKHGGQVWAESTAGRGATFFFTL